ncbi:hypothetical protein L1987_28719 [Smallanthus sonchifolius]|uniref:Uncharacterized protein n=1 Tax=Smallanthus sonchifolius TaxID=185202 RepID=A0ACB9HZ77_9ASTR|nr:hypothetical protein L1987_28719 [Smallanthus sonchifolius]
MECSGTGEKGFVGSEVGCLLGVEEKQRRRGRGWHPRRINDSAAGRERKGCKSCTGGGGQGGGGRRMRLGRVECRGGVQRGRGGGGVNGGIGLVRVRFEIRDGMLVTVGCV